MFGNTKSVVLLVNLCVLCMGSVRDGWPDYNHYPELQGFLKLHQEPVDFRTARTTCHNEGALLASPWTPNFITVINRLQTAKYPSLPVVYSGAGLRAGSPGLPLEPCENKRCSVFLPGSAMSKVNCQKRLPFACFAPESSCGNGYEYNAQLGECYKVHNEGATEPNARIICQGEGGYLAQINNDAEKQFLMSLSSCTFVDNDGGGDAYRHLFSASYSDYYCTAAHSFICEKSMTMVANDLRD